MPDGWDTYSVDAELASSGSMLHHYRSALALRRRLARHLPDQLEWCPAPPGVRAYRRGRLVVACNFLPRPARLEVRGRLLMASSPRVGHRSGRLTLPPASAAWLDFPGNP
jgi:alpha-glucosidase